MLSSTDRRVVLAVVVGALLVVAAGLGVVAAVVVPTLTGARVVAAHEQVVGTALPPGVTPAAESCPGMTTALCGWSEDDREEVVAAVAAAVARATGTTPGEVTCGSVPDGLLPASGRATEVCGAAMTLAQAELWVLATGHSLDGSLPVGRTLTWVTWDDSSMTRGAQERLWHAMGDARGERTRPLRDEEVAGALPDRHVPLLDSPCVPADTGGECLLWEGDLDRTGLGDGPAALEDLVRELAANGYVVRHVQQEDAVVTAYRFALPEEMMSVVLTVGTGGGAEPDVRILLVH